MSKKISVTGLQNIGALIQRNAATIPPKPVDKADAYAKRRAIVEKTMGKMPALKVHNMVPGWHEALRTFIDAAVREAWDASHADALMQNQVVEAILNKQYETRNNLTMPAVVAAVMEQSGMSTMVLDLEAVATVFDRTQLDYDVAGTTVAYSLRFGADRSL